MDTQTNGVGSLEKISTVGGNGHAMVGFSQQYRLLDVRLLSYLMELKKKRKDDPRKFEPTRTVWNCLTRLVNEKRILVQRLGARDRYFYRARGMRPVEKDYVPHCLSISATLVGFTLALRQICNVSDCSPFTDAKLLQPWSIWKLDDIEPEVIPDNLFSINVFGKGKLHFALEEETGKIKDKQKHRQSMRGYLLWRKKFCLETNGENEFGIPSFRVLFMSADDAWKNELREICRGVCSKPNRFFLFSSHQQWTLDNPTSLLRSPIWQSAWGEPQPLME